MTLFFLALLSAPRLLLRLPSYPYQLLPAQQAPSSSTTGAATGSSFTMPQSRSRCQGRENFDALDQPEYRKRGARREPEIRNIDVDHVGNFARLAANFDLANDLFQHALLFANTDGLANQMQRNGNFDLLTLHQPRQIGMDEPAAHRIDLAIVKHHFTGADAFDIERENRVATGL